MSDLVKFIGYCPQKNCKTTGNRHWDKRQPIPEPKNYGGQGTPFVRPWPMIWAGSVRR